MRFASNSSANSLRPRSINHRLSWLRAAGTIERVSSEYRYPHYALTNTAST